ncbi:hypothetical protein CYLTODRAFT_493107 [Cylindrobasidium torrendii FP15055 ss-10]|uniref:Uncharacterized protein n=1 Tax=Cylindrobasidium torrendii FP15055 ss-10 TaxID=1314674 RepID=A0A0D7B4N7_9AGAR|nr:hypothetical protein CYLTODRAFT_493107 [Cylindrobasidium torrendii FP15055 ss-10]
MAMLPVEIKSVVIDCMADSFWDPFVGIALVWPDVLFRIREHRFHTAVLLTAFRARRILDLLQTSPSIASMVRTVVVEDLLVLDTPDEAGGKQDWQVAGYCVWLNHTLYCLRMLAIWYIIQCIAPGIGNLTKEFKLQHSPSIVDPGH